MTENKNGREPDRFARLKEIRKEASELLERVETGDIAKAADELEHAIEAYSKNNGSHEKSS